MSAAASRVIVPGELCFDDRGRPLNAAFRAVYGFSPRSLGDAISGFVDGSDLPHRWRRRAGFSSGAAMGEPPSPADFRVLEVGFGLGVNFLATRYAWARSRWRGILHYVAIEKHPLSPQSMRCGLDSLGWVGNLADDWLDHCPLPVSGIHRITLPDRVTLDLILGDAVQEVRRLAGAFDAVFLDGFAPPVNPELWTPGFLKGLARRLRDEGTLATRDYGAPLAACLADAGLVVEQRHRAAGDTVVLRARAAQARWGRRDGPLDTRCGRREEQRVGVGSALPAFSRAEDRAAASAEAAAVNVAIVGGGVAGTRMAMVFSARGWRTSLHEVEPEFLRGNSGQPLLAAHLQITPDDDRLARLTRAALGCAPAALLGAGSGLLDAAGPWHLHSPASGVRFGRLAIARDDTDATRQRALIDRLRLPPAIARAVDRSEASALAGVRLSRGGIWFERLPTVTREWLLGAASDTASVDWRSTSAVRRLRYVDGRWQLLGDEDALLCEARIVVLCDGSGGSLGGAGFVTPRTTTLRGQSSVFDVPEMRGLRCTLAGAAYASPLPDAGILVGASFDARCSLVPDARDDDANAQRLAHLVGDSRFERLGARASHVGMRRVTRDHLPLIGPVPDEASVLRAPQRWQRDDRLPLPTMPGLYIADAFGSRGLLWSWLAAEVVADLAMNRLPPIASDLLAAIAPERFLRRELRRASVGGCAE